MNTCYNTANEVVQLGLGACSTTTGAYASGVLYAPQGQPGSYTYGNQLGSVRTYNNRLQPSGFTNTAGSTALLSATLDRGTSNNNGNLLNSTYIYNGGAGLSNPLTLKQSYTYDGVNRLLGVTDTGYTRTFGYDPYGNSYVSNATGIAPLPNTPASPGLYDTNNQLTSGSYDTAGNEISVNGNTITYDAESHKVNVVGMGVNETYAYDGDGKRVGKLGNSGVPTTVFVYDAMGRMAAEYSTAVASSPCVTCYLSTDDLGTVRLITSESDSVVARHDYLPFGEEVLANTAGRNGQWGTGNDPINQKFTGKERDAESGLDYFGARYYGSALGRFSSPDEPLEDQSPVDPQSWNLYAYVRNNPLTNTDPNGEDCVTTSDQTDKSVTVTVAAGTCNGNAGTYVNGTVDKSSLTYNGTSVGYFYASYDSNVSLGAGTINLGSSQGGDINPFGLAVIQSLGRQTNSMYGLMGTFAGGSLLGGAAVAGGLAATSSGAALTTIGAITPAAVNVADLSNKIVRQMASRGWTAQDILDTVQNGEAYAAVNKATGGAATEYVNAATGKFVVVDNATKQVLQVSRQGMSPNHLLP